MQASPEKARQFGVRVVDRALAGVTGETALHICFGYGALVAGRPDGYSFLSELEDSIVKQISIETAQSKLDCSVLRTLPTKSIILGVIDLSTLTVEAPTVVASRIRSGLEHVAADRLIVAPDCGMKYLPRDIAFGKLLALVEGARIVRQEIDGRG